jgi:hypothetical protein
MGLPSPAVLGLLRRLLCRVLNKPMSPSGSRFYVLAAGREIDPHSHSIVVP